MLEARSPIPLYLQLKQRLLAGIEAGRWSPGDRIPGDEALQERYGVSRTTVRQALRELELAGLITRHRGRGTFVATPKLSHGPDSPHRLSHTLRSQGIQPGWELLVAGAAEAAPEVAAALGVTAGSPVFQSSRLRLAGEEPIGHLVAHARVDPGSVDPASLVRGGSFDYLAATGRLAGGHAERVLEAVSAEAEQARLLGVELGAPMLRVRRILTGADGQPLEHLLGTYCGTRFQYLTSGRVAGPDAAEEPADR